MKSPTKNSTTAAGLFREAELKEEQRDFRGAFRSYLASANLGDVRSQINVGNYYAAGRGVKRNEREAARWYKRAYRNGFSDGALNLSVDLEKKGDIRNAVAWLKRAIAMGNGDAHLRLARIYLKRQKGAASATDLLKKAMNLNCADISDETKTDAAKLLKRITKGSKEPS